MNYERQQAWIDGYLSYLSEVEKKNLGTIRDMKCTYSSVVLMMEEIAPSKFLWECNLEDYMEYVMKLRGAEKSESTISKQISHIRSLLSYSWRSSLCDRNVLEGYSLVDVKKSRIPPPVLTMDEARTLITSCPSKSSSQRRDRLVMIILYGCGLRSSELCNLNLSDIDRERQEIFIKGKGDKERVIPLPDVIWTEILAYLADRKWKSGPLFRSDKRRGRMGLSTLRRIVAERSLNAGIAIKVTPKILRHTFASHMMERGVKVEYISSLMGHRSIHETGVYLHVLKGRKESAIEQMSFLEGN